jgi:putative peptide zinc metalloprotease protein
VGVAENPIEIAPRPAPVKGKTDRSGLLGLLLTFFLKFAKLATIVKSAFLAASFGAYAVLFSWQFAILIIVSLFVHENGHIWAMRRLGMRTRGIYFIPFIGGAAVAESAFPSRRAEVFVAIMGPIWGLGLAAIVACLYVVTGNALWAAAAGWMAFINLFNLFPVNPLDGGRIVKSIAFSLHSWLGIAVMALGFLSALFFSVWFGYGLLIFIVLIGGFEFFGEMRARLRGYVAQAPMRRLEIAASFAGYVTMAVLLLGLMLVMEHQPGAGLTVQFLRS